MGEIVGAGSSARPRSCCRRRRGWRSTTGTRSRWSRTPAAAHRGPDRPADTIVVMDTHWEVTFEHIITAHDSARASSRRTSCRGGMRRSVHDARRSRARVRRLQGGGGARRHVGARLRRPLPPIFYGTVNIWSYLKEGPENWVSVGINLRGQTEDFLLLGELDRRGRAVARPESRAAGVRRAVAPVPAVP